MKVLKFIILLTVVLLTGCSSSVRFTGEDKEVRRGTHTETGNSNERGSKPKSISAGEDLTDESILETTTGVASYYHNKFDGQKTANGEIYNKNELTAAHTSYPFNTIVRVTNLSNNRSVKVRINDRKPEMNGRLIDLSYAAAKELDFIINGITEVKVDVLSWGNKN